MKRKSKEGVCSRIKSATKGLEFIFVSFVTKTHRFILDHGIRKFNTFNKRSLNRDNPKKKKNTPLFTLFHTL